MTDDDEYGTPSTWDELLARERELKKPIDTDYSRAVAPLRRQRDVAVADVEREYGERMRAAKSRLAASQRDFKAQTFELRRWRDSKVRALHGEYTAEQRVWGDRRKELLAPIKAWYYRHWERLNEEQAAKAKGA